MSLTKELHRLKAHATSVLKAMPELEEADRTLTGVELVEAIEDIGKRYGLSIGA